MRNLGFATLRAVSAKKAEDEKKFFLNAKNVMILSKNKKRLKKWVQHHHHHRRLFQTMECESISGVAQNQIPGTKLLLPLPSQNAF